MREGEGVAASWPKVSHDHRASPPSARIVSCRDAAPPAPSTLGSHFLHLPLQWTHMQAYCETVRTRTSQTPSVWQLPPEIKRRFLGLILNHLNQNIWGEGPGICLLKASRVILIHS